MKPRTGVAIAAASAWLLLAFASPARTDSAGDQLACSRSDTAACTRIIDDATELDGHRLAAYANRGIAYANSGDHDRATADFKEAIRRYPDHEGVNFSNRCLAVAATEDQGVRFYGTAVETLRRNAEETALSRCWTEAHSQRGLACTLIETACDGMSALPAALVPDGSKQCKAGQPVAVSGTIQDIKRGKRSWSAGTIAHVDDCSGLTDPSTGFAALFGSRPLPSKCRSGKRFYATGDADYGREPEFFVIVHKISCD